VSFPHLIDISVLAEVSLDGCKMGCVVGSGARLEDRKVKLCISLAQNVDSNFGEALLLMLRSSSMAFARKRRA
jgi:hypothetical protein